MKAKIRNLSILLLLVVVANISFAQTDTTYLRPTYILTAKQVSLSTTEFVFDIFIKQTNHNVTPFEYAGGQYFFTFNRAFLNGGTVTYRYAIGTNNDTISELPHNLIPRNPSIPADTMHLRLAINTFPGAHNGYIVPDTGHGVRVVRMKLINQTSTFNGAPGNNIRWENSVIPFTKIFAYTGLNGEVNTDISDTTHHIIDFLTEISPDPISSVIPNEFNLSQNYPNPFNPSTKIEYGIPLEGKVSLKIYDITGREVMNLVNEVQPAGMYSVRFDGSNMASGMYFYRINVEGSENKKFEATKKMLLLK